MANSKAPGDYFLHRFGFRVSLAGNVLAEFGAFTNGDGDGFRSWSNHHRGCVAVRISIPLVDGKGVPQDSSRGHGPIKEEDS
ncbi:hypothetical protein GL2_33890 [Microbulbifer sp. GL-2]|nr:hypothetical protein GL2_33890 [Microbulbifer sp. GL-2]